MSGGITNIGRAPAAASTTLGSEENLNSPKSATEEPAAFKVSSSFMEPQESAVNSQRAVEEQRKQDLRQGPQKKFLELLAGPMAQQTHISFEVDSDGDVSILLRDKQTGETVRRIPPEELVELHKSLDQFRGMLFATKV